MPSRRVLPTAIGVAVLTTLSANVAILLAHEHQPAPAKPRAVTDQLVAASESTKIEVAPLGERLTPQLMVVGANTLPLDLVDKLSKFKGVTGSEIVDGAQGEIGGQKVGILGVDPSSFRAYTPKPTAKHDGLWKNIAGGDVAVSFTLGTDGGVKLNTEVPIQGRTQQLKARVGALATVGISDIDAVVSRTTAQRLGMPQGNALIVAADKKNLVRLRRQLTRALPEKVGQVVDISSGAAPGQLVQGARGNSLGGGQIEAAIRFGMEKIGVPYVWGGESDAEGGYDCSGLLQYAFGRAGIQIPRVAADQAKTGPWLPYSQARRGDLLIWANDPSAPGHISHIALYLGGGKMLAAPRTGTLVQIQNVYLRNFKGAVRVNPAAAKGLGY